MKYNIKPEITIRLGNDCQFPISGNFSHIEGLAVLLQDIQLLLLTSYNERVMRPDWGCSLKSLVWENIDTAYINGISSIKTALSRFEPRITVTSVTGTMNRNTDLITFSIKFVIKNTDQAVNLIFPFRSGTSLSFA